MEINQNNLQGNPVAFSDLKIGEMFLYQGNIYGRSEVYGRSLSSTCVSIPQDALVQRVKITSITVADAV